MIQRSRVRAVRRRQSRAFGFHPVLESLEVKCLLSGAAGLGTGTVPFPSGNSTGSPAMTVIPGDFEGIGKTDLAVYRPLTGQWLIRLSDGSTVIRQFGDPSQGDVAVPGDYEGNGQTDLAVFRPSTGQWIIRLSDGETSIRPFPGFVPGDLPVPADYEGIGRTDLAVYRPSTGQWLIQLSSGGMLLERFGNPSEGDIPVPGDYEGIGKIDLAVFRPATDQWFIRESDGSSLAYQMGNPTEGDIPAPGDYQGNGQTDLAVYRPGAGVWIIRESNGAALYEPFGDPTQGDVPVGASQTVVVAPTPYNLAFTHANWSSFHETYAMNAAAGGHNVVFLGDSLTYLWSGAANPPPIVGPLAPFLTFRGTAPWNSTFAPLGAVNYGIPGDTTNNLLWRVLNGEIAGSPSVAVVMIGINDMFTGKTPQAVADGIIAVVQAIRSTSPGTKVLLLGILPPEGDPTGNLLVAEIQATNALIAQWSADHGVTFENFGDLVSGNVDLFGHPDVPGYAILANAIQAPLTSLLAGSTPVLNGLRPRQLPGATRPAGFGPTAQGR